jgi:hypothetical protein
MNRKTGIERHYSTWQILTAKKRTDPNKNLFDQQQMKNGADGYHWLDQQQIENGADGYHWLDQQQMENGADGHHWLL